MDVEKRIETLEKQVRLYRRVGALAVCLMAGALIVGAVKPAPKVVTAEKFVLRDVLGKRRGQWGVDDRGPRFRLFDNNGKRRVDLKHTENGPGLFLFDSKERHRAGIGVASSRPDGGVEAPSVIFKDSKGKMRMFLSVLLDRPNLALYDSSEMTRADLTITRKGAPLLRLYDSNEDKIWGAP